MKAVVVDEFVNAYNEIRVSDVPRPQPKDNEILIQVKAAGVNFVDTLYARGKHQNNRRHVKPPFTLGLEFAGVVVSVPPASSPHGGDNCPFRPGDRVFGDYGGSYAEYIVYPLSLSAPSSSHNLHRIPPNWDFAHAAGLAATFPVSYGALLGGGNSSSRADESSEGGRRLRPGETVLVHAAAGGLGLAAVQIARAAGCRVLGTAGSETKCRVAERFGAEVCVNYNSNDDSSSASEEEKTRRRIWWRTILEDLTGGRGVDVVFDSVGLVEDSIRCLAHRGRVLVVGFAGRSGENIEGVKMNKVLLKQAQIIGYRFGESHRRYPEEKNHIWESLWPLMKNGEIKPAIFDDVEYRGLSSVPRALEDIASRKVWGKAVIEVDGSEAQRDSRL